MTTLNDILDIGQVINWEVGGILSKGIVYDDTGEDFIDVVCVESCNKPCHHKLKVNRNLINKE